jgi:hypothetical protein
MPRATSISAKQITGAAKKSVDRILAQNNLRAVRPIIVGFVPPWWWCGFVIRKPDIWSIDATEKLAVDVHRGIATSVPAVRGGQAGALIVGGHITVGFIPPREITALRE